MCKVSSGPLLSPFIHYVVYSDFVTDREGPDQTARMRRLIWAFAVRICSKTGFAWPDPSRFNIVISETDK